MGSKQSVLDMKTSPTIDTTNAESNAKDLPPSSDAKAQSLPGANPPSVKKQRRKPPPHLKGFALVEYKCRAKKRAYEMCHGNKHSAFVVGTKLRDDDGDEASCEELFEIYKDCIYKGMLKDRQKRGVRAASEESALGVFAEDEKED